MNNKIELLELSIFDDRRDEVAFIESICSRFEKRLGWSYYLDIAWTMHQLSGLPVGSIVVDAGAGTGVMQFILAEMGFIVISVDFTLRNFSGPLQSRYWSSIRKFNRQSAGFDNSYTRHLLSSGFSGETGKRLALIRAVIRDKLELLAERIDENLFGTKYGVEGIVRTPIPGGCDRERPRLDDSIWESGPIGRIFKYRADLKQLDLIPDGYVDAVASISALEHNPRGDFMKCAKELTRITKPRGLITFTTSAALEEECFHEPAQGMCFSEETLKEAFALGSDTESNFKDKERIYDELKTPNNELHRRLDPLYYRSGKNGMPWGRWDPQFLPVGVAVVKK